MKTKLSKTWMPSEEHFWDSLANKHEMTNFGQSREWIEHQLLEFRMYWSADLDGRGKPMANWNLVLWNRMKLKWQDVDKSRMYREQSDNGIQTGLLKPKATDDEKLSQGVIPVHIAKPPTRTLTGDQIADMLGSLDI